MGRPRKIPAVGPVTGPVVGAPEPEEEVTGAAVDVFNSHGAFVRTYSSEIHGKDFKGLAEGFAKKIGGNVKKH